MNTLQTSVAIIKPKHPFIKWVNWANSINGDGRVLTAEYFQEDCTAILIPQYFLVKDARAYINTIWEDIFTAELRRRLVVEPLWPQYKTKKMFWQWFGMEYHSIVLNPHKETTFSLKR